MNIYEEAIKEVKMFFNDEDWVHKSIMPKTIKALERAKKVEELLELYRLEKEVKEKYYTSDSLYVMQHILDVLREIAEEIELKEKELEELK